MIILEFVANHLFGIILTGVGIYILLWVRDVKKEKAQLNVDTVNLLGRKINLETQSKPLDDLVADSNAKHGAGADGPTEVLQAPRDPLKAK